MNTRDALKQIPIAGVSSVYAGIGLMQGVVESSRLALGEVESGLKRADEHPTAQMQAVVESVLKGYGTFFTEMTRAARRAADQYRSESGRLTAKRQHTAAESAPTAGDHSATP